MQRFVSRELTHFAGRKESSDDDRFALLVTILSSGNLTYDPAVTDCRETVQWDPSASLLRNEMIVPSMVCFCDIPLPDIPFHARKYSSFGIAFEKSFLAEKGAAPVFYVAKSTTARSSAYDISADPPLGADAGVEQWVQRTAAGGPRGVLFDRAVRDILGTHAQLQGWIFHHLAGDAQQKALQKDGALWSFFVSHILGYIKVFDDQLDEADRDNYYFEREWRSLSAISFSLDEVARVFVPKAYGRRLREAVPEYYGEITFLDSP